MHSYRWNHVLIAIMEVVSANSNGVVGILLQEPELEADPLQDVLCFLLNQNRCIVL